MPARKYSDETLNEAAELRESGMSEAAIAKRLGMSKGAVYWHCLKLGADSPNAAPTKRTSSGPVEVERSGHKVRRFTEDEDAKLLEMSLAGARVADMCRALGRKHNSIIGRLMTLARHEARLEDAA